MFSQALAIPMPSYKLHIETPHPSPSSYMVDKSLTYLNLSLPSIVPELRVHICLVQQVSEKLMRMDDGWYWICNARRGIMSTCSS